MLQRSRSLRHATRGAVMAVALAVAALAGCAYFNTFYNAKKEFRKAEEARLETGEAAGNDSYQRCIEKCQTLLRYYPKSKYVDDALYLIGISRLHRGEYIQARATLEELLQRFPESEYAERAYYHMGIAALEQDDAAGALQAFDDLAKRFPKSRYTVEAAFRTAESRFQARDFEQARAELQAFLEAHPKSDFEAEGRLQIAGSYYDEGRYEDARAEYARVLDLDLEPPERFEAQFNSALARRALAEEALASPVLQASSRMRRAAGTIRDWEPVQPAPTGGPTPPRNRGAAGAASVTQPPAGAPRPGVTAPGTPATSPASPGSAALPETTTAAPPPPPVAPAAADTLALAPLGEEDRKILEAAEHEFDVVGAELLALRKPAAKVGRQFELEIQLAVTKALRGEPRDAVSSLDQIARAQPRTDTGAEARYEMGEIYRRIGDYPRARRAYEEALRERAKSVVSDQSQRRNAAIVAREQAFEKLKDAPAVLERWTAMRAAEGAAAGAAPSGESAAGDSLGARVALEAQFEDLARQQLRVAEIDLLELDQPLVALRECQEVLDRYPGSLQSPRAAFGIAWIYHHRIGDLARARNAYEAVARQYGDTPQGREARELLAHWDEDGPSSEVKEPSSRQ